MKLRQVNPVLICVDLQLGFLDEESWGGNRNNKDAEKICAKIISTWRERDEKIIHVRHSSKDIKSKLHPDADGFKFNPLCTPIDNETILTKSVNSCFIGTKLKQILDELRCSTVVIIGLTTDHCISTTTRMAGNYGYNTYLVSDATATFNKVGQNGEIFNSEIMHNTALASLKGEFATILSSKELFKMLRQ
jgi:nicotinamidase-related amidase